jgi:hypothetical protein
MELNALFFVTRLAGQRTALVSVITVILGFFHPTSKYKKTRRGGSLPGLLWYTAPVNRRSGANALGLTRFLANYDSANLPPFAETRSPNNTRQLPHLAQQKLGLILAEDDSLCERGLLTSGAVNQPAIKPTK